MSVDELLKWVPIGVASFAGISLFFSGRSLNFNTINFRKSQLTEQIRLTEGILNDIRDLEDKENDEQDKLEWGRKFFNIIEWLSFLINNEHIQDEKLIDFIRSPIHAWHRDWFTNSTYIEDRTRDDPTEYEEFKKLHKRFKEENNWNDCLCSCCNPQEQNKT